MQIQFILIAFHSFTWIKDTIESFYQHFPEETLLVIDNNPTELDRKSWTIEKICRLSKDDFFKNAIAESEWLGSLKYENFIYINQKDAEAYEVLSKNQPKQRQGISVTPYRRTHGYGVNVARKWCLHNDIQAMCCLEPDCDINGRNWFDKMANKFRSEQLWIVGNRKNSAGMVACQAPVIFLLEPTKHITFQFCEKEDDLLHPLYHTIYKENEYGGGDKVWNYNWDMGAKVCFYCMVNNKAGSIQTKDIKHHGCGRFAISKEWPFWPLGATAVTISGQDSRSNKTKSAK